MSDFIFACPSCQGQISASSEHSGLEVACPLCQKTIVIPPDPSAVGAPDPPRQKGKLSMAASTTEHKPQGFAPAPPPRKKPKKIPFALIAEIVGGIALVVVGIVWGPKLYHTYKQKQADKEAAEQAIINPPPPPELSATEVMSKVADKYKNMSSYAATGKTTANLDMSLLAPGNPAAKSITLNADTAIRLGRPDLYRLEWSLKSGQVSANGASWSAGKGTFVANGPYPSKTRNRKTAFAQVLDSSGTLGPVLACIFFDDQFNPINATNQFQKTNGTALNNGQDCYIMTGDDGPVRLELWVDKKSFLIAQAEVFLQGTLDSAAYKAETNSTIKAHELRESQIRGTITETYSGIAVNPSMAPADFEKPATNTASTMMTQPMQATPGPGRRRGGAPQ